MMTKDQLVADIQNTIDENTFGTETLQLEGTVEDMANEVVALSERMIAKSFFEACLRIAETEDTTEGAVTKILAMLYALKKRVATEPSDVLGTDVLVQTMSRLTDAICFVALPNVLSN